MLQNRGLQFAAILITILIGGEKPPASAGGVFAASVNSLLRVSSVLNDQLGRRQF
jgi:hypothetical protein